MLRFANISDADEIAKLQVQNIRRTYKGIYTEKYFEVLSEEKMTQSWKRYFQREDCRTIVYLEDGKLLGFAAICLYYSVNNCALLDYLHVSETAERRGIGRKLVNAVCSILVEEKVKKMEIWCVEGNNVARQFYDNLGARYIGSFVSHMALSVAFKNRLVIEDVEKFCTSREPGLSLGLEDEYEKLCECMNSEYILWGTGNYYDKFVQQFGYMKKPVVIFDNNEEIQGLTVNGVKIEKPKPMSLPVIIASSKYVEIEKELEQLGCEKVVRFYPWHNYICE